MVSCVVAREKQYQYLVGVLQKYRVLPSAILVWGPSSSGKSMVVEQAVQNSDIQHVAFVNAREIVCGVRQFLATIVQQLFKHFARVTDLENPNCDTTSDFVNQLCDLNVKLKVGSSPFVVVLEETETLRAEYGEIIEVLSRLQDMVQFNITVLFLSSLPPSSYSCLLDLKLMVALNFPQYTKDEIVQILNNNAPPGCNLELYLFHVKMTISLFYMACRDLRKLQRLTILNFEKFAAPVEATNTKMSQARMNEFWKAIQPKLARDFKTLKANIIPANDTEEESGRLRPVKNKNYHLLPKAVKYLLLSAYLATHNPPSSDKRFFVKSQLARKKRKVEYQKTEKSNVAQIFPQHRLFAIYEFLTDYSATKNQLLLSQLTHLCDLELIDRVDNSPVPLEEPKYKCVASLEFIDDIAKSLDVDVKRYLYQYL